MTVSANWDIKTDLFLNDEIINQYMDLITQRSPETVYAFNTFFYSALSDKGYQHVSRWTKKVDIFSKEKLFIPVHIEEDNHWCLVYVDFLKKTIKYYDSLGGRNFMCLKLILKYLMMEHINKKNVDFRPGGWSLLNVKKCPKQNNLWDCGVFVCMYAEYLSRNQPLTFSQKDMGRCRKQIYFEIKNKKLIK
ncbi:sentrin-specific protease 1-like [Daktulosphaira vitifoliae]|uniref:sentrin-specific protease 1-like n=1 Tax=Daktulosphaira vitifoliae TaxID=58002 RepID=UPI0021A9F1E4|nr:sentrin-specific protease 1-like [Daktulosphaira vitifoliae]